MIGKGHQSALGTLDERKSMELLEVATQQVLEAVHKLNNRPRKCPRFKTPYEVFQALSGMEAEKFLDYALTN